MGSLHWFLPVMKVKSPCMRQHGALICMSLFASYLLVLLSCWNSSYWPGNGRPLGMIISGAGCISSGIATTYWVVKVNHQ